MCCSQSRVECRGLLTGLLGHCTFPKSSRPRFLRVKTDHGWAKRVGAQIELIRGRRWSWCVHPFIVLIIVFPFFMQNGHCQHALKSKDSCSIAHEMSFSLSKCDKVASFVMQATYPRLSGLFRSRSSGIRRTSHCLSTKACVSTASGDMCCLSISGLRAHKIHSI